MQRFRALSSQWGYLTVADEADETLLTDWEDLLVPDDEVEWTYGYGLYRFRTLAQDQVHAEFPWGRISGILNPTPDIQSDGIVAASGELTPREIHRALIDAIVRQDLVWQMGLWKSDESSTDEDRTLSFPVEVSAHEQDAETALDDVTQWNAPRLASEMLKRNAESNMPKLREMILVAEDSEFTVGQSKRLAPWLLDFAERYRDSRDSQDEVVVWSAMRTGASMLTPNAADALCPLLEPGHSIETSLVAIKMLGRIFEAQPPTNVDRHTALADEVVQIAESLLNRHVIAVTQSAAKAHLSIYALAAMASSKTERMVDTARGLGAMWFTRRLHRKLGGLRDSWTSCPTAVSDGPRALLDRMIETLEAG